MSDQTEDLTTVIITLAHLPAQAGAQTSARVSHGELTSLLTWFRIGKEKTHSFVGMSPNGARLQYDLHRDFVAAIVTEAP